MLGRAWLFTVALFGLACAPRGTVVEPPCPVGSDGCPCTQGGGCDPGQACAEDRCEPAPEPTPMTEFVAPGISVVLPRAEPRAAEAVTTVVVACTADGSLFLDGEPIEEEALAAALAQVVHRDPDVQGIVSCDAHAEVQRLVRIIDQMRSAGVRKYAIATDGAGEPEPEPEPEPPAP